MKLGEYLARQCSEDLGLTCENARLVGFVKELMIKQSRSRKEIAVLKGKQASI